MTRVPRFLVAIGAALAAPFAVAAGEVSGFARVLDGDSLIVGGRWVELHGIDAPERGQECVMDTWEWSCGLEAAGALVDLVSGRRVTCAGVDEDANGRLLAVCWAGGRDLGEALVARGLALPDPRRGSPYLEAEAAARAAKTGIWEGRIIRIWRELRIAR